MMLHLLRLPILLLVLISLGTWSGSFSLGQEVFQATLTQIGQEDETIEITEISALDQWQCRSGAIDVERVVRLGNPRPIQDGGVVLLDDGSQIVATELRSEGTTFFGYNRLWDEFELPLRPIRGLLLKAHLDPDQTRRALDQLADYQGGKDRLILSNGDHIDGTFRRLTALKVEIQVGQDPVELDRHRVQQIQFAGTVRRPPSGERAVWVGLDDGSMLLARQLTLRDDRLTLQLFSGETLTSSSLENPHKLLAYLQPTFSPIRYLSDQEAISFKTLGFLTPQWEWQNDRNVLGGTLKSGGQFSRKGIGMHSTSRLAYRVTSPDVRFRAKVGIDDATQGAGSVIFRVYTSRTGSDWQPVYESPIVRGGDSPLAVDVPLEGARGLALVVEYADGADVQDHANWLDARFEPE